MYGTQIYRIHANINIFYGALQALKMKIRKMFSSIRLEGATSVHIESVHREKKIPEVLLYRLLYEGSHVQEMLN